MQAASTPLSGGRWVPFGETWAFQGVDLTGAIFAMQIRLTPDATGAALVDLATVGTAAEQGLRLIYAGASTVAAHLTAGRLQRDEIVEGVADGDIVTLSLVGVRINETTMESMPLPSERGDDNLLAWDLHVTPVGGLKQVWAEGSFTVRSGVTA